MQALRPAQEPARQIMTQLILRLLNAAQERSGVDGVGRFGSMPLC